MVVCDVYLRLSDLRIEDIAADGTSPLDFKEQLLRQRAAQLGWTVHRVVVENDMSGDKPKPASAYKRRKIRTPDGRVKLRVIRPGFRSVLDDLESGRANAVLAEDLDRLARQPRDLEDFIDVCTARHVNARSLSGSLTFTDGGTDAEIMMARVMAAVGSKSSADTARRVSQTRQRQATEGRYGGGQRPFGYEPGGMELRVTEAAEIRRATEALLAGSSLAGIAADLNGRDVRTAGGKPWTAKMLRSVLLRPRNAGIAVWQGTEAGPARWPAILDEPAFRAVAGLLTDPGRRSNAGAGPEPRWLLSLIATCGICGGLVAQGGGYGQYPRYRCRAKSSHVSRAAKPADKLVSDLLKARFRMPDSAGLIASADDVDVAALTTEANAARARMSSLSSMFGAGSLRLADFRAGYDAAAADVARLDAELERAASTDVLAAIAGRPDAAEIWDGMGMARKRAIVRAALVVEFVPGERGGRQPDGSYFSPRSVRISWKREPGGRHLRIVP